LPEKGNEREGILDEAASEPPATLDDIQPESQPQTAKRGVMLLVQCLPRDFDCS